MSEESKKEPKAKKPRNKKRLGITLGIIAVVLVAAGIGFKTWHDTPGFCAAICHTPMDPYLANYNQEQNTTGTDKYGNEVSNTNAMMAVAHKARNSNMEDVTCLDCHEATLSEQMTEGIHWVTGNYEFPLPEKDGTALTKARGDVSSQFCANENCHTNLLGEDGLIDYGKLEESSAMMDFNPHAQHHEGLNLQCTSCHKGHRASTLYCTTCHQHEDVELPEGWVTASESEDILARTFNM